MEIGDKVYIATGTGFVEEVTILKNNENPDLLKIKRQVGVSYINKKLAYDTKEKAEIRAREILEDGLSKFEEKVNTKEELIETLFMLYAFECNNHMIEDYIAEKLKEYTGVDVREEI